MADTPSARYRLEPDSNRRLSKLPLPIGTTIHSLGIMSPTRTRHPRQESESLNQSHSLQHRKFSYARKLPTVQLPPVKRPLLSSQRPQSKQESRALHTVDPVAEDTLEMSCILSQQENLPRTEGLKLQDHEVHPPQEHSKGTSFRRHRPSLSDRTRQSLSLLPQSPANGRRQSAFFTPTKMEPHPFTPCTIDPRPSSALEMQNVPQMKTNGFLKPSSPIKREATVRPAVSRQTSVSAKLATMAPSTPKMSSPSKAATRHPSPGKLPSAAERMNQVSTARSSVRAPPALAARPTRPLKPRPAAAPLSKDRAVSATDKNQSGKSSSELLRLKIAQAKAAHQRGVKFPETNDSSRVNSTSAEGDSCAQTMQHTQDLLCKRIDDARRNGMLNIAALNLGSMPEQVLFMYDESAMKTSTVIWSETVDLIRINASDNEIEEIGEDVFPDLSKEDLLHDEQGKGNQFGGLQQIDLHGNLLSRLPIGIRRLEMLTSLNLVSSPAAIVLR